jgi:D-threo-aldose 1-dehydrogenase
VARLVFGGAEIGGLYQAISEEAAHATLAAAWDAGVRDFDTAPHYGVGLSERRIGDFLAGKPRHEFRVSTKVGRLLVPATGPVDGVDDFYGTPALSRIRDYSSDGVLRSIEQSLARLRLDRIDVALIHDPEDYLPQAVDETYPALAGLRDQGVVGAIGAGMNLTGPLAWLITQADLDCVMIAGRYTLLEDSATTALFPLCQQRGVRVMAAGVFNSGILAGGERYDYAAPAPDVVERVRQMSGACARHGVPLPAAALRYVLRHPAVTAAVVGARTPAEIRADADYLGMDIPEALWAELASTGLASTGLASTGLPSTGLPSTGLPDGRQPLLDPGDVHGCPGPGHLGFVRGERGEDGPVLGQRLRGDPGLSEAAPHAGPGGRT